MLVALQLAMTVRSKSKPYSEFATSDRNVSPQANSGLLNFHYFLLRSSQLIKAFINFAEKRAGLTTYSNLFASNLACKARGIAEL